MEKDEKKEAIKKGKSVSYWKGEIEKARKREKPFRKRAKEAVKIYEAEDNERIPYNILFSNTVTISSAVYNNLPRPIVSRRFKDKDILGKVSAQVINRFLLFFMDSNDQDYSDFDQMTASAVEEGLVAGRGITRFKYEAQIEDEKVQYETVCGEEVPWDRIYFGYANRWAKVPWIAFENFMTREELKDNFPDIEDYSKLLTVSDKSDQEKEDESVPEDIEGTKLAQVYEIWDKADEKVYFICPSYEDKPLKEVENPLKLDGFFPIPKPLMFGQKISSMLPIPLYFYYEEQALELNRITIRINRIVKAIKVRGMFDSSLEGIEKVLQADDNELIPAENVAALMEGRTLEKSIWLMPIEKLANVLVQLYQQREQIKAIIQELSGIADIMRGASKASETLGAQEMKTQWGGLRITRYRKAVETYIRDCLRLAAEIGFKHLKQETIAKITNLKIPTNEEKANIQQKMQQAQQMQQMGQQIPPPPPEVLEVLQSPTWEEILALCKDDLLRNYKLDIETNSTVDIESSAEKKEIGEFLNALAQFLNGVMPIAQSGMIPASAVKAVLMAVTRKYRFGTEVEEEFEKIQEPKPPQEDQAAKQKAAGDAEAQKLAMQKMQMEMQMQAEENKAKGAQLQQDAQFMMKEAQLKDMEIQLKIKEMDRKDQLAEEQFKSKLRMIQLKEAEVKAQPKKETSNASA